MLQQELCKTELYEEALKNIQDFYETVGVEYMFGIYKTRKYYHTYMLSKGSIDMAAIDIGEVFLPALHASKFTIVHNHPSGSTHPSDKDVEFTNRIMEIAEAIDIDFIDHLIMPKNSEFIASIREYLEGSVEINVDKRHTYDTSSEMKILAGEVMEKSSSAINVALMDNQLHLLGVVSCRDFRHNSVKKLLTAILTKHAAMAVPMLNNPVLVDKWNKIESVVKAARTIVPDVMVLNPIDKEEVISLAETK